MGACVASRPSGSFGLKPYTTAMNCVRSHARMPDASLMLKNDTSGSGRICTPS